MIDENFFSYEIGIATSLSEIILYVLLFLFMNIFMVIIAMKQWTISSTTELSFIFTALIWDSNVSDMKFGWPDLFAWRMSSYLNVLFTRWLQVDTLDGAGPIKAWSVFCLLFNWGFVDCSVRSSVLVPIWIWKKYQNLACSCGAFSVAIIFFYLVMKSWETFFMLNFIYFHFQIAIVKVLYEIRLLSGKSYWKYGWKGRWFVRSLNWCVDSGKLWILDIEVIDIFDSWFWINLDYNSSCCHSNLPGKERICSFTRLCQINSTCDVCFIMSLLLQKYDDILWHWLRVEEESYADMHYLERLCSIIVAIIAWSL